MTSKRIIGVKSSLFKVFEELPPTESGFLVAALMPKDRLKPPFKVNSGTLSAQSPTAFLVDAVPLCQTSCSLTW